MMRLMVTISLAAAAAALAGCDGVEDAGNNAAVPANGQADSSSGGPSSGGSGAAASTIGQTAGQTAELSQFAQAIQSAGLTDTFRGSIPYTVFAPVNSAFEAVPQEARTRLMSPDGRAELTRLLTHHVVPGVITSQDLAAAMERGRGRAVLATIAGPNLTVTREGGALFIADGAGGRARIVQADRQQSNGVIHQIDAVLMPAAAEGR